MQAAVALALLTLINCFGVRAGGTTQNVFISEPVAIAVLVVFGLTVMLSPQLQRP
jgi:hypothetical protein